MEFAPVYLVWLFFHRIVIFFHHWYVDGSRAIGHGFISVLERLDRSLAIRVTLRYFFQPLYKDFTFIGRILGIIFRSVRIAIAIVIYAAVAFAFLVAYIVWLAVPLYVIYHAAATL